MPLSPEEITAAVEMHDFLRRYKTRFHSVLLGNGIALLSLSFSAYSSTTHHRETAAYFYIGITAALAVATVASCITLMRRARRSQLWLALLQREFSDQLPWIKEEKILAAADELEQELAKRLVTP